VCKQIEPRFVDQGGGHFVACHLYPNSGALRRRVASVVLSPTTPKYIIATLIAFVIGITVHEFSHAWSALMLGDDTAERQGRVTLNPLSHLDPIGSIGILFLVIGGFGLGWGRPVPINPSRLRGHQRGFGLTAIAGPLSNLLLAVIFVIAL